MARSFGLRGPPDDILVSICSRMADAGCSGREEGKIFFPSHYRGLDWLGYRRVGACRARVKALPRKMRMKVMIVDDSKVFRKLIARAFQDETAEQIEVVEAENGAVAWEAIQASPLIW